LATTQPAGGLHQLRDRAGSPDRHLVHRLASRAGFYGTAIAQEICVRRSFRLAPISWPCLARTIRVFVEARLPAQGVQQQLKPPKTPDKPQIRKHVEIVGETTVRKDQ